VYHITTHELLIKWLERPLYTASGKPVDSRVSAALSRQDALIFAALDAAERQGTPAVVPAGNASQREAYTDAELAALVRHTIQETIS
jgi:hypothetical protein